MGAANVGDYVPFLAPFDVQSELSDSMKVVQFDKDNIKAIILDMLGAGMDTSANALNWAIPELLRHPKVMKKAHEELRGVVGMDRMVEETDLPK
ncbi:hypothetical protein Scep_022517 [Stephania cephalantha]|uniref:Cytochrome P450 n=1 Tax=Stephania cephalantha TaxID=152367 RepID=A0AAP0HXV1_9MAGN